jgi:HEPN domain-containing protein
MAIDCMKRARSRYIDAGSALKRGDHPDVIRYGQECVELSLKACLRAIGIEYPKVHDVGDILIINKDKFPQWLRERLDELAEISADLAAKRSPAMYGIEVAGRTSSELFSAEDAKDALKKAELVYSCASRLIKELFKAQL